MRRYSFPEAKKPYVCSKLQISIETLTDGYKTLLFFL
jgi:hypothetical protein